MNVKRGLVVASLFAVSLPAVASNIDNLKALSQSEFRALSEDLGAALSYKPLTPTTPLGITGFDVGLAVTATKIKNSDLLQKAGVGKVWAASTPKDIPPPGLSKESFSLNKVFVGFNLNFGLTNLAFEGDRTGKATSYGAKLGFRF